MSNIKRGKLIVFLYFLLSMLVAPLFLMLMTTDLVYLQVGTSFILLCFLLPLSYKYLLKDLKHTYFVDLFLKSILWLVILFGFVIVSSLLVSLIYTADPQNQSTIENIFVGREFLLVLVTVIMAPLIEEVTFRLGIDLIANKRVSDFVYIVIAGLSFGTLHILDALLGGVWQELIYLIVYGGIGCLLAIFYVRNNRNIFYPILLHALYNGVQVWMLLSI